MNAGCEGKQSFLNANVAMMIARKTNRARDAKLTVYQCATCRMFHVGSGLRMDRRHRRIK